MIIVVVVIAAFCALLATYEMVWIEEHSLCGAEETGTAGVVCVSECVSVCMCVRVFRIARFFREKCAKSLCGLQ